FLVQCLRANHLSTGWDTTQALWQPNHSPTSTDFIVVERIAESVSHNRATQWASLQAGVGREADYTLSHHLGQSGDRGRGICPHCSRHDRTVRDIQISIPKNLAKRFGICTCHSHRRVVRENTTTECVYSHIVTNRQIPSREWCENRGFQATRKLFAGFQDGAIEGEAVFVRPIDRELMIPVQSHNSIGFVDPHAQ